MEGTVLTVKETAALLRVSQSKVYQLVRTGALPALSIGRRRVIPKKQLLALLESVLENGGVL